MSSSDSFSRRRLERDWRHLCAEIGERRAGSAAERQAADFIAAELRAAGCAAVRQETFPCTHLRQAEAEVHARTVRGWRPIEAVALVGAPSTPAGRPIEGEPVWVDAPEGLSRLRPACFRGRIVVWFGPLPMTVAAHRRLVAARPAALVHIDDRLPFAWAKSDGVFPHWARRYGMPPIVTVPYSVAWRWRRDGNVRLRLRVMTRHVTAESQNVVAELPGTEPHLPALLISAHHDTQCGNPGADDNASGVVCLLALARRLATVRHRRALRFVSFGTEEQLSVGSAVFVRRHRPRPDQLGLVVNLDSVASPLGHLELWVAGVPALAGHAARTLQRHDVDVRVREEITPFADNFPLNCAGIPSLLLMRTNFPGGRWQHHSRHDTLENVSVAETQRLLGALAPLVTHLAARRAWPFPSLLPPAQLTEARKLGREYLGNGLF